MYLWAVYSAFINIKINPNQLKHYTLFLILMLKVTLGRWSILMYRNKIQLF